MTPLPLLAAGALLLALLQQQLLLQRPPRLDTLRSAAISSGPAALDLRFSRPMRPDSIAARSRLSPPLPHEWLGSGSALRLLLSSGSRLQQPLSLSLEGRDPRGLSLAPQRWLWDPRPRVVAVVESRQGDQVQLRDHDGRWIPLTPHWPRIQSLQPLGDGSGLLLVSLDARNRSETWRLGLRQRNLAPAAEGLAAPQAQRLQRWQRGPLMFATASSNRLGDLLVQSSADGARQADVDLWEAGGRHRRLPIEASGPIQLVPQGGAMVVPHPEGLMLQRLSEPLERPQVLPGQRDLSSFCPSGGAALLVQHRPDYSRALELLQPGRAPRPLWQGNQGILASACDDGGQRAWLLLVESSGRPKLTLLGLDGRGTVLRRRELSGWELEPGSGMQLDRTRRQLLLALRPLSSGTARSRRQLALPALIDADSLSLQLLPRPVRQVQWLPAG